MRNRIVMAAMGSDLADDGGLAGSRIVAYYEARARGGVGLITTEAVPIAFPAGFSRPHAMALRSDSQRAAIRNLVDAVHQHGASISLQLNHHGPISKRDMIEGRPLLVPSIPEPAIGDMGSLLLPDEIAFQQAQRDAMPSVRHHEMSHADIAEMVEAFARNAVLAREAGADAVEIHAAHGFLLSSFLSPRSNRRTDQYGGTQENRARFLVETISRIRTLAGEDFPIICKIDTEEFLTEDGVTPEGAIVTARLVQQAGASALTASTTANPASSLALTESNIPFAPERMLPNAARIKAEISIPVIASGRMEPESASRHIARGNIDFAGFGRKLLADPEFASKLVDRREADIRPCVYCYACISQLSFDRPVKCAVNPETGHETTRSVRPTEKPLRIVIVGGGPAGMEAAFRLAAAGHQVILFETEKQLGGTLRFAALAYPPNQRFLDWQVRRLQASGVDLRLGAMADVARLKMEAPDLVVVAAGARRAAPDIPGIERRNVLTGDDLRALLTGAPIGRRGRLGAFTRAGTGLARLVGLTRRNDAVRSLSRLWMPIGRRVVIIGGELVGLELAEFLAERGRKVTIIDDADKPGAGMHVIRRARALHDLRRHRVEFATSTHVREIIAAGVVCADSSGELHTYPADTVIHAKGATGNRGLADELRRAGFAVREIGDVTGVGYIEGATADAADLARELSRT